MVREAGGFISDAYGKDEILPPTPSFAATRPCTRALLGMLKEARAVA